MEKLLYGVEDRPPSLVTTTLLSLQHLLAALGGIIAVPLVFGGALKLPADQIVALVNAALLGSGIVTIIQCRGVGPVGIRLPCVMGTSFAFVGAGISVGMEHGVPGILGSSLVGSLVMIIGSFFMPVIRRFFPHTVTSVVVTMIGLSLTPVAVDWAAGGVGSSSYGSVGNLAIAGFVLALVIGFVQWGKGIVSASAVVLGIACGYLLCLALGLIDFTQVRQAPIFAIPQPLHFGMTFPVSGIVAMSIAFLVTIVETTGTFMALGAATQTPIPCKRLSSGMLCDGVGSAFAAVMSSPPVSTFAQNVGVVSLTGVASRHVVMLTGVMLLLAGLVPVLGALVGNAVGTTVYELGKDFYDKREAELLARYAQELKALDTGLDGEYAACISGLRENMSAYIRLLEKAFSPNVAMAFSGSVELAARLNVPEDEILHTREEVDDFFLN